ncbi:MAG: prephenate dehydrogenase/arogenate dehydrogenase family protein [Verrucomicrobiae bacterium]|nr:prephenate dehydrogenase/arogenate dehydrogenase family protein [Verrucomicrobiae bacterium]MCX7722355.1 prephenate dehydrogenase/arogenate dehydrogenase family protein [Verrucomicrobiae bacterium]MDW7980193.1 prephenate dehydrogenase/arogenate dehydrogenase family protein [Verrucomicrobiales bacterium]
MRWHKVTIVGVGLLGGSLGLALRKRKLAVRVVGFVRRQASIAECCAAGAVDAATLDLEEAVSGADLVVLCTPIGQMRALAERFRRVLQPGAIVTDVGSVKLPVVRQLEPLIGAVGAHFVGSHPMAGSEKTGVRAARAELFERAVCVITPTARSDLRAVAKIEELWQGLGARTIRLSPARHDALVSFSSHLPHVAAAALVRRVLDPARPAEQALLCAEGFKDTTRIASSSPQMWSDIAIANSRNLARAIDGFIAELQRFKAALARRDARALTKFFEVARSRRDAWCAAREAARGR